MYSGRERTFERKIKEACLAIKLSDRWSKNRILADLPQHRLLRQPRLRGRGGCADVLLAPAPGTSTCRRRRCSPGLPQAPSIYDPFHNPKAAIARRDEVLRAMLANERDHAAGSTAGRCGSRCT